MPTPYPTQLIARLFCQFPESQLRLNSSIGELKPLQEVFSLWTFVDAPSKAALNLATTTKETNLILDCS